MFIRNINNINLNRFNKSIFNILNKSNKFNKYLSTESIIKRATINVVFTTKDKLFEKIVEIPQGMNMLEAAHINDIELEGACEGGLACSTCHLIVTEQQYFDKLPEATEDEEDMLDLAFDLTDKSRLGCQIIATEDIDGIKFIIPMATRNMMIDK
jgi:ferredoxin